MKLSKCRICKSERKWGDFKIVLKKLPSDKLNLIKDNSPVESNIKKSFEKKQHLLKVEFKKADV